MRLCAARPRRPYPCCVFPNPHAADTASQRPATGLDRGARALVLQIVEAHTPGNVPAPGLVVMCLFQGRYADVQDYFSAVTAVWGSAASAQLSSHVAEAQAAAQYPSDLSVMPTAASVAAAVQYELLLSMPEPDFRLAVELALTKLACLEEEAVRISTVLQSRGVPWRLNARGFVWVGDETVERHVLSPAHSRLQDPRLAGGPRSEFAQALVELRLGTPTALKQVLGEAAASVESTMKIICDVRGVAYDQRDTAQRLWEHLRDASLIAADTECLVLACARARNKRSGHGAGAEAHVVLQHEAEAFTAAAAAAIVFLASLLP
jgi:hypothetical protein